MRQLIVVIRVFLFFTVLLGGIYPLAVRYIGKMFFSYQASGSLLVTDGHVIGSYLIAQEFTLPKYFHSRPSAINYNALISGGSNLSVFSPVLYERIKKNIAIVKKTNRLANNVKIPADMVSSSASGLDPHISLENAMLQLPRVARERKLNEKTVQKVIQQSFDNDFVGIWGNGGVNVLRLNLMLDQLKKDIYER